ncbi:MAG: ABC transporter permease [Acidimicrobiales bacterium]
MTSPLRGSHHPGGGFELTAEPTPVGVIVADVWRYRRLLAILARKDFFVKFRRASLGMGWAVLLPLIQALVMAVVLQHFVKFKTGINYAVFVFAGTLIWSFFAMAVGTGSTSIVDGQGLSTKVYFPRALFPLVSVAANVYGTVLTTAVLIGLAIVVGVPLDFRLLWLVPALGLTVALTAGFSLVFAVMHVYLRDMKYVVSAALTAWVYATPVFYKLSVVGHLRPFVEANPVTGAVEMTRAALGAADTGWWISVVCTVAWILGLFAVALALYRRFDRVCTDLL